MTVENDYRRNAAETIQLAQSASSSPDKGRLLKLAEAWLDPADRARRISRNLGRPASLHPLIRQKLDRYTRE